MSTVSAKAPVSKILAEAGIALIQSLALNAAFFFIGSLLGAWGPTVLPKGQTEPIGMTAMLMSTTMGVVVGTLLFLLIRAVTPAYQKVFLGLVVITLILFAYTPFGMIEGGNAMTISILEVAHLVPAGFLWWRLRSL